MNTRLQTPRSWSLLKSYRLNADVSERDSHVDIEIYHKQHLLGSVRNFDSSASALLGNVSSVCTHFDVYSEDPKSFNLIDRAD
jgi:hypothetical protein